MERTHGLQNRKPKPKNVHSLKVEGEEDTKRPQIEETASPVQRKKSGSQKEEYSQSPILFFLGWFGIPLIVIIIAMALINYFD